MFVTFKVVAITALLIATTVSHAGDFRVCRRLENIPMQEKLDSHPPPLPSDFSKMGHMHYDGTWLFNAPLETVWNTYLHTSLKSIWNSKKIRYGFAVDSNGNPVDESSSSAWPGLSSGFRFFLEIEDKWTGVFCGLGMGIEITEIVPMKSIRFEYLDFSPAFGQQWILFDSLSGGRTLVQHVTRFEGKNILMDGLYLHFHQEAIPALHDAVVNLINYKQHSPMSSPHP